MKIREISFCWICGKICGKIVEKFHRNKRHLEVWSTEIVSAALVVLYVAIDAKHFNIKWLQFLFSYDCKKKKKMFRIFRRTLGIWKFHSVKSIKIQMMTKKFSPTFNLEFKLSLYELYFSGFYNVHLSSKFLYST